MKSTLKTLDLITLTVVKVLAYLWLACSVVLTICALAWGWIFAFPAILSFGLYKLAIGATRE